MARKTLMNIIRHICMGIFDLDTNTSGSLAKKRRKAIRNLKF